jgi:D-alanine-D-alanine ligase
MPVNVHPSDISVLFLYNLDPTWTAEESREVSTVTLQLFEALCKSGYHTIQVPIINTDIESILSNYNPTEYIAFNWCENIPGIYHSEWLVADHLEKGGFTFTGASSEIIAKSQDKSQIKKLLDNSGIATPFWQIFDADTPVEWDRFPAIVKPSMEHCSEGIDRNAVCETKAELVNRIRYIIDRFQQPALVEDFIDGRELHVSLWGNGHIDMLPPAEMEFSMFSDEREHLCSYEAKFVPDSIQYQNIKTILPAPLTEQERFSVESACKSAYRITGCRDYARIDMRIKDGIFYIIDVNPNSDISPDTSTILAAEIEGYNYENFLDRIVRLAARRHPVWGKE